MSPQPSYLSAGGLIEARAREAHEHLRSCDLCPHACGVDRTAGETGLCRTTDVAFVASHGPHFCEERPLVGVGGSGTIFFARCNLSCVYCQNWDISHLDMGREAGTDELASMMLELQSAGCHNINLVTPTHQLPMILDGLAAAASRGLSLPIVYNCGGYESAEALRLLDGIVDIYMPDLKYMDGKVAAELSGAPDYPEAARAAIRQMHSQVGDLRLDGRGIAERGLIVRHLVLPGGLSGTAEALRFIAEEISRDTYINIMDQYHPTHKAAGHPHLGRRITREEYEGALEEARRRGLWRIAD